MKTILCIAVLFTLCSCSLGKIKYVNTSIIPSDFEYSNSTLLVEVLPKGESANRKIEELLKKEYNYKYEMASYSNIMQSTGKYEDTTQYRFAILSNIGSNYTMNTNGSGRTYTTVDYHIYDRIKKIHYPATDYPASFAKMPFETLLNTLLKAKRERH
jgi:hypothetical protein